MASKRPTIPIQLQALPRRPRRGRRLRWALIATGLVATLAIWFLLRSSGESASQSPVPASTAQGAGPPWRMGNPQGRFTLTLYADLECPFCRSYYPVLKRWVGQNADVALQWHHLPLAAHEPAASAEARLAECVGDTSGHAAFWQAVEWVYARTRGEGQGLPESLRYPDLTPAIEQCLTGERAGALVRTQAEEATQSGVTATPSLRLHDRETGKAILLQGPIEGDALLSAMDMLASGDPATTPTTEMPADVVGDMPR